MFELTVEGSLQQLQSPRMPQKFIKNGAEVSARTVQSIKPRFFRRARPRAFPPSGGDGVLSSSIFLRWASSFYLAACRSSAGCS